MSSHLDLTGCAKRKREEKVFKFKTFCDQFDGPFRQNVKTLLEFGHFERHSNNGMLIWSFKLEVQRHPPVHVFLFVVEESAEVSSVYQHCKQCQYIGWGHHMICNKKYHFLVTSMDTMVACLSCECSEMVGKLDLMSKLQEGHHNHNHNHIMYGVFHSNGFGHLMCINGIEMGSKLAGHQIMDFWDRLCIGLRVRKVNLFDISQKRGMHLRLLYGVAYSEPWFGRWGYKFGRGSFNVTQQMYHKAIQAIKSTPLCLLIHHLGNLSHEISIIFSRYQVLSNYSLATLGDLLHFMLEFKSCLPKQIDRFNSYNHSGILHLETSSCRWSPKRVEMATRVIVEALKRVELRWVSRQEVRDAARAYIGDTGLLDFVLKSLGNQVVGNYLVRRSLNPVTKVLEYRLEDISNASYPNQENSIIMNNNNNNLKTKARYQITRVQLMKDMFFLYKNILKEQRMMMAARIILDTKYFIKDYYSTTTGVIGGFQEKSKVYCSITLKNNYNTDLITTKAKMLPYESVVLRSDATFDELKLEVEQIFRDLYWGLKNFIIESVVNFNTKVSDLAFEKIEDGCKLVFEGIGNNIDDGYIYESGHESSSRVVECPCGTKEDDGERMVCCDICEVWQHTRCVRIPNSEQVPHIFLCNRCEQDIIIPFPPSSLP